MSVSSQTRGSVVEQLLWCEGRIAELETRLAAVTAERDRLRESMETIRLYAEDGHMRMVLEITKDAVAAVEDSHE